MPYISKPNRKFIDDNMESITIEINSEGDLNYTIFRLLDEFVADNGGPSYINYNKVMGVLDCCAREYYRRRVAPYEDKAIERNGDIPLP